MITQLKSLILLLALVFIAGCSTTTEQITTNEVENKGTIMTSFYATQEITQAIVAENFEVKSMIPPGVELHGYEPKPSQLVELSNSQVYVAIGGMFEHLEEEVTGVNSNINIIYANENVIIVEGEEHEDHHDDHHEEEHEDHHDDHHEEEHENHHNHGEFSYDPHIWLSVENMIIMTRTIEKELSALYPELSDEFESNSQEYISQLRELKQNYESQLSNCAIDVALVNHKAFGYIAQEYGFEQVSAAGFSHENEPSAREIEMLISKAQEHGVSVIFSEGGVNERVSSTIANEVGSQVLPLYPTILSNEDSYFSIMNTNLEHLAIGLECDNS